MTSPTVPSPRALTEEKLAAVLAAARCQDVHGDAYTPPYCHACRGWAAHLAQALAQAIDAAGDEGEEPSRHECTYHVTAPLTCTICCPCPHCGSTDADHSAILCPPPIRRATGGLICGTAQAKYDALPPAPAPREAAEREALAGIRDLHAPETMTGADRKCVEGECDHEPCRTGYDFPETEFLVCKHCVGLAEDTGVTDEWYPGWVMYPCATIRLLPTPHEGDSAEVGTDG